MQWEKPYFVELSMNAEIGSYQADLEEENGGVDQAPAAGAARDGDGAGEAPREGGPC